MDNLKTTQRLNIKDIVIGKKKLEIPFELFLSNNEPPLQCSKLLRFVPGKRAVFSGLWGEKNIAAKFFFKPFRYKKHVNKEIKGNYLLEHAGIPTSKILYSEFCKELKSHILIFEFIEGSTTLEKIFESDKNPESDNLQVTRKRYLIFLVRLIAKIHQKGLIHNDLHPDNFLLKKETIYALDGASIRQVSTATVVCYKIDGKQLVIKRYNMKNRFHAFRLSFKKTRADISWHSAHLLLKNRINTPEPVAVKEIRFGPLRNRSFFIYEYIKGKNARQFFLDAKAEEAKTLAESIINLFYKLKSLKISHGDMKATNIIIHDDKPFLIDLDSMKWHKRELRFSHAWKKDMKRFMKNWDKSPELAGLFKRLQE